MKRKFLQEPGLSELVYTVAMTSPVSARRLLPTNLFHATKTAKMAKKFAATSSSEEKKQFLGYLGFKTLTIVSNVKNIWETEFREILTKFENGQGDLEEAAEKGLYITSDKKLITMLESMAGITGSRAYIMGLELFRTKIGDRGWPKKLNRPEVDEVYKKEAQYEFFVKAVLAIDDTILSDQLPSKVNAVQLRILLYLFLKRNAYVSHDEFIQRFTRIVTKADISNSERKLLESLLIQRHLDIKKHEYTITARGILMVSEILHTVVNTYNFYDKQQQ